MQQISFRIWTRVTVSISYDDNHYTTGTSLRVNVRLLAVNNSNKINRKKKDENE